MIRSWCRESGRCQWEDDLGKKCDAHAVEDENERLQDEARGARFVAFAALLESAGGEVFVSDATAAYLDRFHTIESVRDVAQGGTRFRLVAQQPVR